MPAATLSRLELNRATLARQGLLEPIGHGTIGDAVARVGSLQAQHPDWPPIALWTRAGDRAIPGLAAARRDRSVVRAPLMRITVQVIASANFWPISIITQPLRAVQFRSIFKADVFDSPLLPFGRLADADREALEAQAAGLMSALESAAAIPRG
jgi:hypothetical protein